MPHREPGARSASVKDVAAAAGVSLGTVSNVLNRPDRVSPDTREKVQRAMLELGFVRNESARQLRAGTSRTLAYVMLDQCHNIEPKIPAQIRSVMNVQEATAKALLIDTDALGAAQQAGDVLGANAAMMDAFSTDVRPLLGELRGESGLDPDPLAAYARSGYGEKIVAERVGGTPAGWGS